MDILVISREFPPYVLGGISYHLRNLYTTIASEGHNVTVVAGRCRDAGYSPECSVESAEGERIASL